MSPPELWGASLLPAAIAILMVLPVKVQSQTTARGGLQ
jgi:hypothetical protein